MDNTALSTDAEANHEGRIIATVVIFSCLSVTATSLRIISRRMKKISLGVDDYLVIFSLVEC